MEKRTGLRIGFILALVVAVPGLLHGFNPEAGDSEMGKDLFQKCRACHDGGSAEKMSPALKTKKQWSRYFENDFSKLKKKMPDWDSYAYTDEELEHIHRYLVEHALDSSKPLTCD